MTTQEFSDQFDVLYNSISSNLAPSLDEYEKSVFLTKGLSLLIKEYFDSNTDPVREGFDGSIRRQYDFSSLIKSTKLYDITHHWDNEKDDFQDTFDIRGVPFILPEDYFLTVNEVIRDYENNIYAVDTLSYSDYEATLTKPFPFPNKREAWRIMTNLREISYGTTTINYEGENDESKQATVICKTAFASEGKDMLFTLQEGSNLALIIADLRTQGIIKDEIWNIYSSWSSNIDAYMLFKRDSNYHELEAISCTFEHLTKQSNVKLWDDDFSSEYTFDGVTNAEGEIVDCVYQDTSAIAITSVTVTGEASALGVMKIYAHLTKDLENSAIGKDPYTLIASITFKHWEEGVMKEATWVVWNGGWGYTETISVYRLETPYKIPEDGNATLVVYNNCASISKNITVYFADSATSNTVIDKEGCSAKAGKHDTESLLLYAGKYIIGFTCPISNMEDDDSAYFTIVKGSDGTVVYYTSETISKESGEPTEKVLDGTDEATRIDMINVRHWDFMDLFDWPQRIKIKDLIDHISGGTVFTVRMEPSSIPAVEIIGRFKNGIKAYMMRYVKKPTPIVLDNIGDDDVSIEGITTQTECALPEELHEEILERAVLLAKIAYSSNTLAATQQQK